MNIITLDFNNLITSSCRMILCGRPRFRSLEGGRRMCKLKGSESIDTWNVLWKKRL
jgi:hypothetical protein